MKPGGEMRIDKRKNPLNFRPDPAYVLNAKQATGLGFGRGFVTQS